MIRLTYLTNIPSPYRVVMIREWARHNRDLQISVCYTDEDDQGRGWQAPEIGSGVSEMRLPVLRNLGRYGKLNGRLRAMVRDCDVLMIGGFEQGSYLVAALWAKLMGKPVILLFDGFSPARFGTEPAAIMWLKRRTAALATTFFANGTVGRRYLLEQVGIRDARAIYNQYLCHAQGPIDDARAALAGQSKAEIRRALGIDDGGRRVIATCGYLIHRKRIDLVIDAIARLPEAERPLLLVMGDGPLADDLAAQASRLEVPVHFAGFLLGDRLAQHYFAADALVLASSDDPWGLVVNEAMAAELPVLVSNACGAALDLVRDGENGYVFKNGDEAHLTEILARLLADDMAAMGSVSLEMIAQWTPAHSAEQLARAVEAART